MSYRCAERALVLVVVFSLISCRGATEITLHVHTNLPCASDKQAWKGVAVYVGKPGNDVEEASPTLVTRTCDADGNVGSLVVVPSGSKSAAVGLRVVAGLDLQPEDCRKADYVGCIVARRTLRFTPHDGLDLDVQLTDDCVSVPCDPSHTCRAGNCETSVVKQAPEPTVSEGEPSVRCGDDGVRCATTGNVCCLAYDAALKRNTGDCRPSEQCPPSSIVLNCDDDSDCPQKAGSPSMFCALSYTSTQDTAFIPQSIKESDCRAYDHAAVGGKSYSLGLCEKRLSCVDGMFQCGPTAGDPVNLMPSYSWCAVSVP